MNKTVLYIVIGVIVLAGLTVAIMSMGNRSKQRTTEQTDSNTSDGTGYTQTPSPQDLAGSTVLWQSGQNGWEAMGTPPACPNPLTLALPVDNTHITSILYPGQTRGADYKPHGGFRLDNAASATVKITAPFDGNVIRASRYIEADEVQYMFDIVNSCGILQRFDHLFTLSPVFQKIADGLPEAKVDDSRTNSIEPAVAIKTGDLIATEVGHKATSNISFDWGVYDLRQKNEVSKNAAWAAQHGSNELAPYAVCWFDWLSASDEALVRSLPSGDPTSDKTSDYCK